VAHPRKVPTSRLSQTRYADEKPVFMLSSVLCPLYGYNGLKEIAHQQQQLPPTKRNSIPSGKGHRIRHKFGAPSNGCCAGFLKRLRNNFEFQVNRNILCVFANIWLILNDEHSWNRPTASGYVRIYCVCITIVYANLALTPVWLNRFAIIGTQPKENSIRRRYCVILFDNA
jgi:hypothetical protein